jgi:type I restriction enzyme S subunit
MELREGYKLTEVGVIPEDWDLANLGSFSFITKLAGFEYSLHFNSYKDGGNIIVVRGTNITNNKLDLSDVKNIPEETSNKLIRSKLFRDDLVFAYVGTIGPIFLVQEDNRFHLGPNTCKITVDKNNEPKFIFHYFTSHFLLKEISERTSIGAQPSLSMGKIRSFRILLPPTKSEQAAIATALSDADALIRSLEKLIEKKRAIKQGAMQELLKPKEGWVVKRLGAVCIFFSGGTPSTSVQSFYGGNIPWITSSDLNKTIIEDVEGRITKKGLENSSSKMVNAGTLLVALYGATAGVTAITEIEAAINQAVLAVIPKEDDNFFLFYQLTKLKNWILSTFIQGGQGNLSGNIFKELELEFPEIHEQKRIAKVLSEMDSEISALEQKLTKCKMLKQGMMQELLTGRIRLV